MRVRRGTAAIRGCLRISCPQEAVELAGADYDLADFDEDGDGNIDALTFLHSGQGAELSGSDDCWGTVRFWFMQAIYSTGELTQAGVLHCPVVGSVSRITSTEFGRIRANWQRSPSMA